MNERLNLIDSIKNILMIFGLHIIFFISSWIIFKNLNLLLSVPIFVIISIIHQKFIGEFLHEGSHFHLNSNKTLNEIISNYLVGIFFFVTVKNYRKKHFAHHKFEKYFNDEDPETGPVKIYTKKEFWKNIIYDLIGINGFKFIINYTNLGSNSRSSKSNNSGKLVLDKSLLVLIILQTIFLFVSIKYNFIIYYLIYYYTLGTLYHLQLRFRILGQHAYLSPNNVISYSNSTSRTIKGGLLEKLFFTSDITAYHELHHKYPNLPYRTCKDIFIKQIPKENINTFLKKRSTMLFNFYRSLA